MFFYAGKCDVGAFDVEYSGSPMSLSLFSIFF